MQSSTPFCVAAAAVFLAALHGCGSGGQSAAGGGSGTGGRGGTGGTVQPPGDELLDRADVSYADNLLQKVADEEWTLGEGIVATLQAFAGERDIDEVLRYPELVTYESTGVLMLARRYLVDGPDADAQSEITRLLASLEFTVEELEQMAGLDTNAPFATKQNTELCTRFFDGFLDPPIGLGPCLEVESVMIGDNEHRLFFPADPLPTAGWGDIEISQTVDALADSIPIYDDIGDMPAINIVFSVKDKPTIWGESFPNGAGECTIVIYTGLQTEPQERFQQLVAHEIAHCLQGETWPGQTIINYDLIKWHFEGGAEFFSNLVYPEVNLEYRHLPSMQKWELLSYVHNRSYENFIFFQYLANRDGVDGIVQLMEGLPKGGGIGAAPETIGAQREGLADYPDMARIFQEFTEALTDGAVRDTSGELIPYAARALEINVTRAEPLVIYEPALVPFRTYRFLVLADEDEVASLEFREGGTLETSARRAARGAPTDLPGRVTETTVVPGLWPWTSTLPTEVPEEECDSAARMIVVTTTKNPTPDSGGVLDIASFEGDVTDVDSIQCCLHGTWAMNNDDLASADTLGIGAPTSYSGSLTATYTRDGSVNFVWGPLVREIEDTSGVVTAVISGAGTQFYTVAFDGILDYSGPEILVSVSETAPSGQSSSFTALLDTALGDYQATQFFECTDATLTTTIRGDDLIGWERVAAP